MIKKQLDCDFEIKSVSEDGLFEGYGSVFGVKDSYSDIVAHGAFADSLASLKALGRMPALLWQHRSADPIGVYKDMHEDDRGLHVTGQLALKTVKGAEAYELLKMKAISGLSIGYVTREDSFDRVTGINTLKKIDLWECSLCTFPANDSARISGVKTIETIESLRDAERYLRDSGMSRAEAVAFISRIKGFGQSDSDESDLKILINALKKRQIPA